MIETKGLQVRLGERTRIRYQDLCFAQGETYVLLGASGCGKTTLLNMIAGVLTPTEGSIAIDGREMTALSQKERDSFRIRKIGYIFQDFKLLDEMTVEDNIRVLELEHIDTRGMGPLLDQLGIGALRKRRVSHLSGGEKQRVAIARALIKQPDIILGDEPTGNLNYAIGSDVVDKLIEQAHGRTLIVVTHDDRLADRFDHVIDMTQVACNEEV